MTFCDLGFTADYLRVSKCVHGKDLDVKVLLFNAVRGKNSRKFGI